MVDVFVYLRERDIKVDLNVYEETGDKRRRGAGRKEHPGKMCRGEHVGLCAERMKVCVFSCV